MLVAIAVGVVYGQSELFADKEINNMPNYIVWNNDLGEYYNSDDFIWNSETKTYEPRMDNKNISPSYAPENYLSENDWIAKYENSDNEIDRALVEYYYERNKNYAEDPDLAARSYYVPEDDKALEIIYKLDIQYIPELLERIENFETWSGECMLGVMNITGVEIDEWYPAASVEGSKIWTEQLSNKLQGIEKDIDELKNAVELNDSKNIDAALSKVKSYGIFGMPYIYEITDTIDETSKFYGVADKYEMFDDELTKDECNIIMEIVNILD